MMILVGFEIGSQPVVDLKGVDDVIVAIGVGFAKELDCGGNIGSTIQKDLSWAGWIANFTGKGKGKGSHPSL